MIEGKTIKIRKFFRQQKIKFSSSSEIAIKLLSLPTNKAIEIIDGLSSERASDVEDALSYLSIKIQVIFKVLGKKISSGN